MESSKRPTISFEKAGPDTLLLRNGYIVETADLSAEGLHALAEENEWAILQHMRTMESDAQYPDLDDLPPRPAIYLARMAIRESDAILPFLINRHVKHFSSPAHITDRFIPYWQALSRTRFEVYAGVVEDWDEGEKDGVWIGVRQPHLLTQKNTSD